MDVNDILIRMRSVEDYSVLIIPFALMVIDFATGIFNAWATGHLKSYKMRDGLNKKFAEIMMLVIGLLFTWVIDLPFYVVGGLTVYVVIMELVSICENLDKMGVKIPAFVKNALKNAEDKIQNESSKEADDE